MRAYLQKVDCQRVRPVSGYRRRFSVSACFSSWEKRGKENKKAESEHHVSDGAPAWRPGCCCKKPLLNAPYTGWIWFTPPFLPSLLALKPLWDSHLLLILPVWFKLTQDRETSEEGDAAKILHCNNSFFPPSSNLSATLHIQSPA